MLVRADKKWDYAIGMIKVDGLEPTDDMKKLIEKEKKVRFPWKMSEKPWIENTKWRNSMMKDSGDNPWI